MLFVGLTVDVRRGLDDLLGTEGLTEPDWGCTRTESNTSLVHDDVDRRGRRECRLIPGSGRLGDEPSTGRLGLPKEQQRLCAVGVDLLETSWLGLLVDVERPEERQVGFGRLDGQFLGRRGLGLIDSSDQVEESTVGPVDDRQRVLPRDVCSARSYEESTLRSTEQEN